MLDRREQEMIVQAQQGNRRAFGELVSRYQNLVTSIAFSRTGDLQRSEDIAQQVFLIAWEKRLELRDPDRYRGWLRSITRNVTLNSNRKTRGLDRSASSLNSQAEPAMADPPGDAMATREQQELLWASLQNIPEDYREPLILFYREDQSVKQVAESLGLSTDAVKQRLVRGRAMLKSEVAQFVEDLLGSTKPSASFVSVVVAALPAASSVTAQVAVKSGFILGGKSMLSKLGLIGLGTSAGVLGGVLGGVAGVWAAWFGTRAAVKYATSEEEERLLWWFFRTITGTTLILTLISIGVAFLLSGLPLFTYVMVSTVIYTAMLAALIIRFIGIQKRLHEIHGKPAYPQGMDGKSPQTPGSLRFAAAGATIGCWTWVFVLAGIDRDWLVIGVSTVLMLGNFARLWLKAAVPMTAPQQMRMQATSVVTNAAMAAVVVSLAGFFGSRLDLGPIPNWTVALGVFVICSLVSGGIWYGASKAEQKLLEDPN